ncbi:hypothetical protein [Qipengyuania nanhaisediminis]|uniref:hypothetical protein n=1 Tax=Qipengyuania nanhaisediminis TaxID=604088 RepID=UPI0038B2D83B
MTGPMNWDAHCTLHRADDGGGLLDGLKGIRRGSLAQLVRQIMMMPRERRREFEIEKSGDHRLNYWEIAAISRRGDFPFP